MNVSDVLNAIDRMIAGAKDFRDRALFETLLKTSRTTLCDGELRDLEGSVSYIERLKKFRADVVRSYEER